jgi:hypothetical protein
MEDVHAFQDLVFVKKNKGSSGTGSPSSSSLGQSVESWIEEVELGEGVDMNRASHASLTKYSGLEALDEEEEEDEEGDAGPDAIQEGYDEGGADQSPASSISGDDIDITESDLHAEEQGDVVVELPDPSRIQKEHDSAVKAQDSSVMAVEDKSDNEELNLEDQEAVEMPTSVMEELRISDECRIQGKKSRDFDTTEGDEEVDSKDAAR